MRLCVGGIAAVRVVYVTADTVTVQAIIRWVG